MVGAQQTAELKKMLEPRFNQDAIEATATSNQGPHRMEHGLMQTCNSTCFHCAQVWFLWLKSREAQMRRVMPGQQTSFATAATTSNRPSI
jgi:hypothetical protein